MALKTTIRDGEGDGFEVGVTSEHALKVSHIEPSVINISTSQLTRRKIFRNFLRNPPGAAGSKDLNVDGSVTPVEFVLEAEPGVVRWIQGVRFIFHGTNLELDTNDFRRFGEATAINSPLTNGVKFWVEQGGIETNVFAEPVQRMGDFMTYADRFVNFVNAIGAQEDFLTFDVDFETTIATPEGSLDRIVCQIRDDLTDIDLFQVIVRGTQESVLE